MGKLIQPAFGTRTIIASDHIVLDSNVVDGGGTDQTAEIQAILDKAPEWGGLHLYMDGAALVSDCLQVHSDTKIECPSGNCGFFLKSGSDTSLIANADIDTKVIRNRNIILDGGTYNFNSPSQNRYKGFVEDGNYNLETDFFLCNWTHGMRFVGVENLIIRGVSMVNQRTYAGLFANWERVVIENVDIPLPDNQYAQNQDGLHFFGPGRGLSIKNLSGCAGDDMIALAPDELDHVSSITDVVIDGLFMKDADQGIRMLSRNKGRLDRVFVRNVYGTYKSCGFFINPWFGDGNGNYGSINFENIHLQPTCHKYEEYAHPFLFRIGGYIESLTIKNVKLLNANDTRPLFDISHAYAHWSFNHKFVHVINLTIDGLEVVNTSGCKAKTAYISVDSKIDNLIIRNVLIHRANGNENDDTVVLLKEGADIGVLSLHQIVASGIGQLVEREDGTRVGVLLNSDLFVNGQTISMS